MEILFRGLTQERKWVYWNVYGELVGIGGKKRTRYEYHRTQNSISYYCHISQLRDSKLLIIGSVGQFTGLVDENGKKIFEGDIVKFSHPALCGYVGVVDFEENEGGYVIRLSEEYEIIGYSSEFYEVIGNIHDNPELLEAI